MQLPVLLKHEFETGTVARIKQYEIKAHQFLVDLEEDAKVFLQQGFALVAEGERAVEIFQSNEVKPKSQRAANKKDEKAAE